MDSESLSLRGRLARGTHGPVRRSVSFTRCGIFLRDFELPIEADAGATGQELGDAGYKTSVFPLDPGAMVSIGVDLTMTRTWRALAERHDERLENLGPQ